MPNSGVSIVNFEQVNELTMNCLSATFTAKSVLVFVLT